MLHFQQDKAKTRQEYRVKKDTSNIHFLQEVWTGFFGLWSTSVHWDGFSCLLYAKKEKCKNIIKSRINAHLRVLLKIFKSDEEEEVYLEERREWWDSENRVSGWCGANSIKTEANFLLMLLMEPPAQTAVWMWHLHTVRIRGFLLYFRNETSVDQFQLFCWRIVIFAYYINRRRTVKIKVPLFLFFTLLSCGSAQ